MRGCEDQIGVAEGVVADGMTSLGDGTCDIRPLLHITADQKECSMDLAPGQDFEQVKSVRIVRAVVVGQSNLL